MYCCLNIQVSCNNSLNIHDYYNFVFSFFNIFSHISHQIPSLPLDSLSSPTFFHYLILNPSNLYKFIIYTHHKSRSQTYQTHIQNSHELSNLDLKEEKKQKKEQMEEEEEEEERATLVTDLVRRRRRRKSSGSG